jgi:hypothetical protein
MTGSECVFVSDRAQTLCAIADIDRARAARKSKRSESRATNGQGYSQLQHAQQGALEARSLKSALRAIGGRPARREGTELPAASADGRRENQ